MAKGTRIALGLAGGYVLGRYHKARWLMLLAAGAAATRAAGSRMEQGESSADLTKLAEQGREVAAAIVGSRMEGITRRIHDTTESLRQGAGTQEAPPEDTTAGDTPEDTTAGDTAEDTTAGETAEDTTAGETAEEPSGEEQPAGPAEEATGEPRRGQEAAQRTGQRSEPKAGQRSEPKTAQKNAEQPAAKESRQRATASPGSRRPESRRRAVESGGGRGRAGTRGGQRQG